MFRILRLLILLSILFFTIVTCRNPFAPALTDEDEQYSNLLTQQKTPDGVLTNFRFAYTFKDSLVYSEVLDSTFIFRSIDYNQYPPKPIEWNRDTELRTTARMFRYFNTLDLVWNNITVIDSTDMTAEYKVTFTLTMDGGRSIPPLNGEVLFRFIQREKKYYISFWEDQKI